MQHKYLPSHIQEAMFLQDYLLTWSANEVDSMLINSLSAVSLHICSHFIFRNLSRSSRITPGRIVQYREREEAVMKRSRQRPL